jgi:hypothetical protein
MAENDNEEKIPKDAHQMVPLLPPTYNHTVGLDCLRMIDTISVKQIPSLSEGKSFKKKINRIFIIEVICGIPSQAKFDVFNEKKERIFQALESNPNISFEYR